jgi:hypothetical protein
MPPTRRQKGRRLLPAENATAESEKKMLVPMTRTIRVVVVAAAASSSMTTTKIQRRIVAAAEEEEALR